jgi:hypothetical protein
MNNHFRIGSSSAKINFLYYFCHDIRTNFINRLLKKFLNWKSSWFMKPHTNVKYVCFYSKIVK